MATWVTHLMIADRILIHCPELDTRGFCVGNIAPDCNVESEDWSYFTPSREVTHWMSKRRKVSSDCESFFNDYFLEHTESNISIEHYSFLLGYYVHLITDAEFQWYIRDDNRVKAVWRRINKNEDLHAKAKGCSEDWDSVKKLISMEKRLSGIYTFEAEYLKENPNSGYFTEILPLEEFPDYIDYLPKGSIVRKIGVMGYLPEISIDEDKFISISKEELLAFVDNTVTKVISIFKDKKVSLPSM